MYMYIFIYLHTYIYIYTYIHTYLHIYTHLHIYTYIHTYLHIYAHLHIYTYIYTYSYIHIIYETHQLFMTYLLDEICGADATSHKLLTQRRLLSLFRYAVAPPQQPRSSWLDAQLKQSADLADVGPGSYDPDWFTELGAEPEKGKTIAVLLTTPPNTNPGPGAYSPRQPQIDKRILPRYIEPRGGSILAAPMQELVTCLPGGVGEARQWLERAAPSNGLLVQLLKQRDWVDPVEIGSPHTPALEQKRPRAPRTPLPATTANATSFVSGTSPNRKHIVQPGPGSGRRVFLVVGTKDDLDRVLGEDAEMARVGLMRSSQGPRPVEESAGPAYNVPSTFDMDNRFFSATCRAGHVQTREWLDYRWDVELNRNPGPGAFAHMTVDRTGRWDAPIQRITSGLPSSKACQGTYAYTMGLPRKMLPHMDPLSPTRMTPSVQSYESFTTDKTGKAITFLESRLSTQSGGGPAYRIALKTPYTGADLRFTRDPNNGVPGVGTYETEALIGNPKPTSKPSVPGYSIANETLGRASQHVTHVAHHMVGTGMIGMNTDFPQRPQTVEARMHSMCAMDADGHTQLKSNLTRTNDRESSPPRGTRSRSQSPLNPTDTCGAEVYSFPPSHTHTIIYSLANHGTSHTHSLSLTHTRLRPRPPASPPTRILSTLREVDLDTPGMQKYNIPHTIGSTTNAVVRNAPQYTVTLTSSAIVCSQLCARKEPYNRMKSDETSPIIARKEPY